MTLAHAVLKIFCSQASNCFQCKNLKKKKTSTKGFNSATTNPPDKKQNSSPLNFHTHHQDNMSM